MRCCGVSKENGLGTVEGAFCMVVLMLLVAGGFSLVSYLERIDATKEALDAVFSESALNPFRLQFQQGSAASEGGGGQTLNTKEIQQFLERSVDRASLRLAPLSSRYLVEAAYLVLSVDPRSGELTRTQSINLAYRVQAGPGVDAPNTMAETDLGRLARGEIEELGARREVIGVPAASFGLGQKNYLPSRLLLVSRAILELRDGLTQRIFPAQGREPVVVDTRVVILRGDVQ